MHSKIFMFRSARKTVAVCVSGLDDTDWMMKTNDMSETVDRNVVILLIHLTAHLPIHTHKHITATLAGMCVCVCVCVCVSKHRKWLKVLTLMTIRVYFKH